jgi:hypothetical protein
MQLIRRVRRASRVPLALVAVLAAVTLAGAEPASARTVSTFTWDRFESRTLHDCNVAIVSDRSPVWTLGAETLDGCRSAANASAGSAVDPIVTVGASASDAGPAPLTEQRATASGLADRWATGIAPRPMSGVTVTWTIKIDSPIIPTTGGTTGGGAATVQIGAGAWVDGIHCDESWAGAPSSPGWPLHAEAGEVIPAGTYVGTEMLTNCERTIPAGNHVTLVFRADAHAERWASGDGAFWDGGSSADARIEVVSATFS